MFSYQINFNESYLLPEDKTYLADLKHQENLLAEKLNELKALKNEKLTLTKAFDKVELDKIKLPQTISSINYQLRLNHILWVWFSQPTQTNFYNFYKLNCFHKTNSSSVDDILFPAFFAKYNDQDNIFDRLEQLSPQCQTDYSFTQPLSAYTLDKLPQAIQFSKEMLLLISKDTLNLINKLSETTQALNNISHSANLLTFQNKLVDKKIAAVTTKVAQLKIHENASQLFLQHIKQLQFDACKTIYFAKHLGKKSLNSDINVDNFYQKLAKKPYLHLAIKHYKDISQDNAELFDGIHKLAKKAKLFHHTSLKRDEIYNHQYLTHGSPTSRTQMILKILNQHSPLKSPPNTPLSLKNSPKNQ